MVNLHICNDANDLGKKAAEHAGRILTECIQEKGKARLVLSTGQSQFEFFENFVQQPVDWSKVEMFHLDEYVGLPESHPASFRKYLKERFTTKVPLGKAHFVNGEGDIAEQIAALNEEISKEPVDLGLIGIGENAHIAFNDPPANFDTDEPYIVVDLDDACKQQQVREGWFPSIDDVPKQAITMSVKQILKCEAIISCVPHQVKAEAIRRTLTEEITNVVPATILKTHRNWSLYLDPASSSQIDPSKAALQERSS